MAGRGAAEGIASTFPTKNMEVQPEEITINVHVVYMARHVMILTGSNTFRGPLEGVASFLGPERATSEASDIWAQQSREFKGQWPE